MKLYWDIKAFMSSVKYHIFIKHCESHHKGMKLTFICDKEFLLKRYFLEAVWRRIKTSRFQKKLNKTAILSKTSALLSYGFTIDVLFVDKRVFVFVFMFLKLLTKNERNRSQCLNLLSTIYIQLTIFNKFFRKLTFFAPTFVTCSGNRKQLS